MAKPAAIPYGEDVPEAPQAGAAKPRGTRRIDWFIGGLTLVVCACWMISDLAWAIDLLGSFAPQLAGVGIVVTLGLVVRKAWWPAGLAVLGVLLGFLSMGVMRADRVPTATRERTVRVLQYNANTTNVRGREAFDMIMASDADIVAITEPPQELLDLIRAQGKSKYTWTDFPPNAGPGWRLTLSRWPIQKFDEISDQTFSKMASWVLRIQRPAGEFVFVQAHPPSPRSHERWAQGRDELEELAKVIDKYVRPMRLPIIMAADLNSPPSGVRGRMMHMRFGFERAKPRLATGGTYPASVPAPLRVAIDDVFVDSVVGVSDWKTVGPAGSDHLGVCVDIVLRDLPPEPAPSNGG